MGTDRRGDRRGHHCAGSAAGRYAEGAGRDPRERDRAADTGLCGGARQKADDAAGAGDPEGEGARGPVWSSACGVYGRVHRGGGSLPQEADHAAAGAGTHGHQKIVLLLPPETPGRTGIGFDIKKDTVEDIDRMKTNAKRSKKIEESMVKPTQIQEKVYVSVVMLGKYAFLNL